MGTECDLGNGIRRERGLSLLCSKLRKELPALLLNREETREVRRMTGIRERQREEPERW